MLVSHREKPPSPLFSNDACARGGVLATKAGYFGVKSTKVCRDTFQIKPAEVGHLQSLGVNSAKVRRFCATKTSPPRSSLRGRTKVAKLGPLQARVKSAKVRPTPYVYYPPVRVWLTLKAAFSFIRFAVSALGSQRI